MNKLLEFINKNIDKLTVNYWENNTERSVLVKLKDGIILTATALFSEDSNTCYGVKIEVSMGDHLVEFDDENGSSDDIFNTLVDKYNKQEDELRKMILDELDKN